MEQFMPAFPLEGAKIVVVGSGEAAENKLRLFRNAPCMIDWYRLADEGHAAGGDASAEASTPRDLNPNTTIYDVLRVPFGAFNGALLTFIATEDEHLAQRLRRRAKRAGILVNVVDNLPLCDFYTPALLDRGAVTIALTTGGAAPVLVRDLRSALEGVVPKGIGLLAGVTRTIRSAVTAVTKDVDERRRYYEMALRGRAAELADAGDEAGVRRQLLADLDRFKSGDIPEGVVHLVGAGPGDPELMTMKGARLLRDADVIVHDQLVSAEVLDLARRDAIRIDVGKRRANHSVPQDEINQILIDNARAGRRVVRLKGGDSFVFGRGGEEVEALRAAGVDVRVTPGVSAALACSASAQAPLTHRDMAQAVTFVTGQPKKGGPDVDYRALSAANHTVVIYMGVHTAQKTAEAMIGAGRDPQTPIAVVENGSRETERVVTGRLAGLGGLIADQAIEGPAVIIVGEVATMAVATPDTGRAALLSLASQAKEQAA